MLFNIKKISEKVRKLYISVEREILFKHVYFNWLTTNIYFCYIIDNVYET